MTMSASGFIHQIADAGHRHGADLKLVAVGSTLMSTPLWVQVVQGVSLVASMVAAVCGAVVGAHAVYRIIRRQNEKRDK
jgi:hypothetical protein